MFTLTPGSGITFRNGGPPLLPGLDFQVLLQEQKYVLTAGTTTPGQFVGDAEYSITTSAVTSNRYNVAIVQTGGNPTDLLEVDLVASGAGQMFNGFFDRRTSGIGTLRVSNPALTKEVQAAFGTETGASVLTLTGYVNGSLAKSMSDSLWPLASGKNATHLPVYTAQNPNYVRNADCWVSSLDWTGVSPWNSSFANLRAGTAISPRHIVFAWHYQIPVGSEIHFVTADNQIVSRTLVASQSASFNYVSDTTVGLLNADLPPSIKFYKIFPDNLHDYFGSLNTFPQIPVVGFDQQEKALMKRLTRFAFNQSFPEEEFEHPVLQDSTQYPSLTETIIGGDSGNPVFGVVNNEPILLTHWTTQQTGPPFHSMKQLLDDLMTSLGGGYTTTTINLTGFTNYAN
jgi:hypothetical protein